MRSCLKKMWPSQWPCRGLWQMVSVHRKTSFLWPRYPFLPCREGGPNPADRVWEGGASSLAQCTLLPPCRPSPIAPRTRTSGWGWASARAGWLPRWGWRTTLSLLRHIPLTAGALLGKIDSVSFLLNCSKEFLGFRDIFVAFCRSFASPFSSSSGDTTVSQLPPPTSINKLACRTKRAMTNHSSSPTWDLRSAMRCYLLFFYLQMYYERHMGLVARSSKQTKTKFSLYASVGMFSSIIHKDRLTSKEQLQVALPLVSSKDLPAGPLSVSHHHKIVYNLPVH